MNKETKITRNGDSDSEESSDISEDEQKFIEIRDVDVYSEVLNLQGELKVASMEISRLREQLTLIGNERG